MDELDLTKAEMNPTYEAVKNYVFEHDGLRVTNLYIAQVREKYGLHKRKYCGRPKTGNTIVPKCPQKKEEAIVEALRYFAVI